MTTRRQLTAALVRTQRELDRRDEAVRQARTKRDAALLALIEDGCTYSEAAAVLGVVKQRIPQLLEKARERADSAATVADGESDD